MSTWLEQLKMGDKVITCSGYYGKGVAQVERVTATQIILVKGSKFWKKNGKMVGDTGWQSSYITEPTAELLSEIRKALLCGKLRLVVWERISVETLEDIFEKVKSGQHLK